MRGKKDISQERNIERRSNIRISQIEEIDYNMRYQTTKNKG